MTPSDQTKKGKGKGRWNRPWSRVSFDPKVKDISREAAPVVPAPAPAAADQGQAAKEAPKTEGDAVRLVPAATGGPATTSRPGVTPSPRRSPSPTRRVTLAPRPGAWSKGTRR